MHIVTVFLLSEADENGEVVGVQYGLDSYQHNKLLSDIDEDKTFIQFGSMIHHSEDIIKIVLN
jgi:hypothetical protein